ncbi:hypothetical protein SHKM778_23290 [Streptomyces sp. KM77-8]|uniref:ABC transporter domain-containing protein n=1 Tax=Streptomyces haneummycinicus TaxID=3074435 RepID=A0AAT9HEZ7_9ACTN
MLHRVIQATGLTSSPRKELPPAVDDVSFEAHAGRVTALLGAPGAGKSTALRLMLELQRGRGITYFRGRPLHRIPHPAHEVGVLLGDVPGHPARTVRGHLRMLCAAAGVPVRRADEVLEAAGLVNLRDERLGTLSRGMDRRLGLACALLPDPHTLVLDEPAKSLSAAENHRMHDMLRAYAAQGGTVLCTTADPKEAARIADHVVTLERGGSSPTSRSRTSRGPGCAPASPSAARTPPGSPPFSHRRPGPPGGPWRSCTRAATASASTAAPARTSARSRSGTASSSTNWPTKSATWARVPTRRDRTGGASGRRRRAVGPAGNRRTPARGRHGGRSGAPPGRPGRRSGLRGRGGIPAGAGGSPVRPRRAARTRDAGAGLPPAVAVRPAPRPLRPLRYEIRRATGVSTGFLVGAAVLAVSALTAVLLARAGHTPQPRLLAAWPRELPLPPAALGAGLLGALAFGDEFRHPALAADRGTVPRRLGLLTAKLLVASATALVLAVLTVGCDAELLYLVYGRELVEVPADWLPLSAGWLGLVTGCACAGVLAAGVFRSTTAGLAVVVAVPLLVVPLVRKAMDGTSVRSPAPLSSRLRDGLPLRWPFGGEQQLDAVLRVIAQPVGGALTLSLAALLCAYLFAGLRSRVR